MAQMTKSERLARRRLMYHLWVQDEDSPPLQEMRAELPEAWHTVEADIDCYEPKEKITLYLDQSVAKLFRGMGKGYQARLNRILQLWLQMKMAGLMEEDAALSKRRSQLMAAEQETGRYPGWGPVVRE
ncbi:BrnA antitoxin family protein [uncultured Roseobacter sp.]|uniref:BrnA antitoxin family protein n=1 Tax=uncultured Roseobacter sp. TaxID=114847 RepID=UPI00261BD155|nr:BrnA antitoxin family protein [uncultured Roseobacter sp.]